MTNLNGFTNWVANADIAGGTLVTINTNGQAVSASANTETLVGVAINNAVAGEVVAVKLPVPVAKLVCGAGAYVAGAKVYLGANGKVAVSGDVACGWYVGPSVTLTADGELDIALGEPVVAVSEPVVAVSE